METLDDQNLKIREKLQLCPCCLNIYFFIYYYPLSIFYYLNSLL